MTSRKPRLPAAIKPFLREGGPTPLQVLQGLMKMHLYSGNWEAAGRYASEAAPYRHAKAVAVGVQGQLFGAEPLRFAWEDPAHPTPGYEDPAAAALRTAELEAVQAIVRLEAAPLDEAALAARIAQVENKLAGLDDGT